MEIFPHLLPHRKLNAALHNDNGIINCAGMNDTIPYIKILEQPAPKALRFRYECEGRSAGSIPGINSTPENKTYPTIQIVGYRGRAVVVVSCVTKDQPYRPHPHNLVGKEGCKKGICTLEVNNDNMIASFSNLGIQCVKKKDIEEALRVREEIRVDPFRTGFSHRSQANSIDLNAVRLCFQAFLDGSERGKFDVLTPVVSDPIYDKKAMSDLVICRLSDFSASVIGGKEIILLCEKVAKDDIQVRFFEESGDGQVWEGYGDFTPAHVHKQVAITFRTPRYKTIHVDKAINVYLQLRRPSDGAVSEPVPFTFTPLEADPVYMKRKRQKSDGMDLLKNTTNVSNIGGQCNENMLRMEPSALLDQMPFYKSQQPQPSSTILGGYQLPVPSSASNGQSTRMSGGTLMYTNVSPCYPSIGTTHQQTFLLSSVKTSPGDQTNPLCLNGMTSLPPQMGGLVCSPSTSPNNINAAVAMNDGTYHAAGGNLQLDGRRNLLNAEMKPEIDTPADMMTADNMELSLSRLDSKDLAELSLLDAGNLSENLSSCLTLSDKPQQKLNNDSSMTDSLTKLADKAINDLYALNQLYHDKK